MSIFMQYPHNNAFDRSLLVTTGLLVVIGFIAMSSASIEFAAAEYGNPFFHSIRYLFHLCLALVLALAVYQVPITFWFRSSWFWLALSIVLLLLVLIPGIGTEVNGSRRWLKLGPFNLQPSEFVKLFVLVYLSAYLVRRQDEVRQRWSGFLKPLSVLFLIMLLLMLEPDFGATVVTLGAALGMLFLAGVKLWQFLLVIGGFLLALVILVISEPYRMQRLTAYVDPWADQFNSGYQLTQALIAFGRGEWFGVGLGNSIQKLFYLPEAHTDFVFAIFAEEFGLLGSLLLIALFLAFIWQILRIGRHAELLGKPFSGYLCYGIGLVFAGQMLINMGVNTGLLPTKGLTLPFLSYGGSSLLMSCMAVSIVCRVFRELNQTGGRATS